MRKELLIGSIVFFAILQAVLMLLLINFVVLLGNL